MDKSYFISFSKFVSNDSSIDVDLSIAITTITDWDEDKKTLLKGLVIDGVLDMALVYSGDYFDELYYAEEEEIDITFGYFPMLVFVIYPCLIHYLAYSIFILYLHNNKNL